MLALKLAKSVLSYVVFLQAWVLSMRALRVRSTPNHRARLKAERGRKLYRSGYSQYGEMPGDWNDSCGSLSDLSKGAINLAASLLMAPLGGLVESMQLTTERERETVVDCIKIHKFDFFL